MSPAIKNLIQLPALFQLWYKNTECLPDWLSKYFLHTKSSPERVHPSPWNVPFSVEKVETLQLPFAELSGFHGRCCLTARDVPEIFLVPNVAISGERAFFSIALLEDWPTRSRAPRGALRRGGRGTSDGFGLLHSCGSSHQWPCSASSAVTHPRADPGALW